MGHRNFRNVLLLTATASVCLALAGCGYTTQATSGERYLKTYADEARPATHAPARPMDEDVRTAAAVEPLLRFPARIGLARIGQGVGHGNADLTGIPEEEAAAWQEVATKLGPKFGEFVPISPLVAEMFDSKSVNERGSAAHEMIRKIRLAAARQHVDAVIVYESAGTADSRNNPLSIGEWTLIGAFMLPSQDVKARGVAQAMMIDVRNGYPYGTVQAQSSDETSTSRFSTHESERDLSETVRVNAVKNLAPEVEKMMRQLRVELAEARERPRGSK